MAFFLLTLITILSGNVKADMLVFWNFDNYTTEGSTNYVTDSVHSERLKLVDSSIEDGKLFANGGFAEGTGNNRSLSVSLPLGQSQNPNYTMSAFLATTHNVYQGVGIIAWGTSTKYKCNSFRTLGGSEGIGLNSYWWDADVYKNGYDEVYNGLENHVATTGDATNHYVYLNGQLIASGVTHAREEANQNFMVGNSIHVSGKNVLLYGTIDNAAVYNEILQHSDIITISSSKVNGLTNWWKSGQNVDRISGIVKPDTVTGTTVITGANGDVMVFNRALEAGEQTYYQGQLATGHEYVIDNMAGSNSTKTTWLRASSANLSDAGQTPLGIYVGGTTTASTLTATADQLNSVNRTLVIGGGTLAIATDSDVSIDKNRLGFDSGSISTSGTGTITINSSENLSFKAVNIANSILNLNSSGDMRIIGSITGSGNLTKSGSGSLTLSLAPAYTGDTTVSAGTLALSAGGTLYNLSGGSLDENGQIDVPGQLIATGNLTLNNSELTKFIGSITAPVVTKTGLDTLQLCFDAQNAVNIGSLVVSSGRVDLKGYMQGGITVDANGIFSPGNSVGEAKFGGGYELYDGAKLLIEMDETGVDSLIASSFNENNGIIELAIDGIPFGSHYDVITATNGFSGTQDEAYWLGKFGTLPDYMTLSVVDGVYGANSQTVRFSIDRNAVPEPSTWALLALGAVVLFLRKRVRN